MTTTRTKLIDVARSTLGTKERPKGSNIVKFSRAYGLIGAWCNMWVWWIAASSGAGDLRKTVTPSWASCQAALAALRRLRLVRSNKHDAAPGDIAFFQFDRDAAVDHVGLIIETRASGIVTIEGNTSSTAKGSQSNGGMVAQRFRSWSVVAAVASLPGVTGVSPRPQLPTNTKPATATALKQLARDLSDARRTVVGDGQANTPQAVTFVQWKLGVTADGKFGPKTRKALVRWQKKHGLIGDGIVGPATWAAMYPR